MPFSIKNPELWWTHNLGNPYLYDIDVELLNEGYRNTSFTKKLGIRSIELVTEKTLLEKVFTLNSMAKPVYMKGANYIPQNIFLPDVDQGRLCKINR